MFTFFEVFKRDDKVIEINGEVVFFYKNDKKILEKNIRDTINVRYSNIYCIKTYYKERNTDLAAVLFNYFNVMVGE